MIKNLEIIKKLFVNEKWLFNDNKHMTEYLNKRGLRKDYKVEERYFVRYNGHDSNLDHAVRHYVGGMGYKSQDEAKKELSNIINIKF